MKKIYIFIFLFFVGFKLSAQGDGTMNYTIEPNPTGLTVKLTSSVAHPIGSAINFVVSVPPMTMITNFAGTPATPFAGLTLSGTTPNEYVLVTNLPAFTPGETKIIATFKYTSTAPPGTTGAFTILNDGSNYIEYGSPAEDRSGPPINNANAVILPIKLSKFDVKPFGGIKASDLRWTSVSEVNAAYFDIERSADGITFSNIGRTEATGNSNLAIDYNYIDRSLPTNRTGEEIYYYRLNMVDLDGTAEYSEVRSVRFDNNDEVIVKMGPNPTSNVISINMSAPSAIDTDAPANVYDAAGRLVTSKKVNTNGVTEIDLSNYPNAIYNISVEHNGKTYNNRIIKSN